MKVKGLPLSGLLGVLLLISMLIWALSCNPSEAESFYLDNFIISGTTTLASEDTAASAVIAAQDAVTAAQLAAAKVGFRYFYE